MTEFERRVIAIGGVVMSNVHPASDCAGEFCWIDNPSPHQLRDAPVEVDAQWRIVFRVCPHGLRHPDPDDAAYRHRYGTQHQWSWTVARDPHPRCDFCCIGGQPTGEDHAAVVDVVAAMAKSGRRPSDDDREEILRHVVRARLEVEQPTEQQRLADEDAEDE